MVPIGRKPYFEELVIEEVNLRRGILTLRMRKSSIEGGLSSQRKSWELLQGLQREKEEDAAGS